METNQKESSSSPIEWTRGGNVAIYGTDGTRVVPAEYAIGIRGLCIANIGSMWTVTHIESGMRCSDFVSRPKARAMLIAIAPLLDWTAKGAEIHLQLAADVILRDTVTRALHRERLNIPGIS